jgi:hypothetical protein
VLAIAPLHAIPVVFGAVFSMNFRDGANATQLAAQELQRRLQPGERVIGEVAALQRHWYDVYRATYGVLAATDRRVIFAGVVPELYAQPDGPRVFDVQSFPFDSTFGIAPTTIALGARGALVESAGRTRRFTSADDDRASLSVVIAAARHRATTLAEARQRERAYYDSIAALPPIREYHRVTRGDALESIARHYETTPESIRGLNRLAGDRIYVGETLLVRESPRPVPPCPATICGVVESSEGAVVVP